MSWTFCWETCLPCATAGLFAWRCALRQTWEPPGEAGSFPPLTGTRLSASSGRSSFFQPSWGGGGRKKGWSRENDTKKKKTRPGRETQRTERVSRISWDCHLHTWKYHCLTQHLLTVFTLWNEKLNFYSQKTPTGSRSTSQTRAGF